MALFRVVVRKAISGSSGLNYKWSNVWYCDAATATAAAQIGAGIWAAARGFHNANTYCYEVYASDLVPNTTNFAQIKPSAASQYGTYGTVGDWYHSSVVCRVDLTVANSRPSRKFFRPPWVEGDVANGQTILAAYITALTTGMNAIIAVPQLRDESGNTFLSWVNHGITTRRLGRDAFFNIPQPQGA